MPIKYEDLTDYERFLRILPRHFYAMARQDKEFPQYGLSLKQYYVYRVHLQVKGKRRLDEVRVRLPSGAWSPPIPLASNFEPKLNYKLPPKPKKKKWRLEIYVPNPRLVKRKPRPKAPTGSKADLNEEQLNSLQTPASGEKGT